MQNIEKIIVVTFPSIRMPMEQSGSEEGRMEVHISLLPQSFDRDWVELTPAKVKFCT